ncbi:TPA: hypothetical protein JLH60_004773 [Escherichia coli]|nr:hypothetical protein [Escherichia coli]
MPTEKLTLKKLKDQIDDLTNKNESCEQWIVGLISEIDRLQGRVYQLENLAADYEQETLQDEEELIIVLSSFADALQRIKREFKI